MNKELTYGEMFCGPGGLAKGAMLAGAEHKTFSIKHAWATDIDTPSCETYSINICGKELKDEPSIIDKPIIEVNIEKDLFKVNIFAFGFPCNDFSLIGKRKGLEGSYGPLYTYAVKYLNIHKPEVFVAENVGGLTSDKDGAFETILRAFIKAGYNITVHKYHFEKYGVPQKRKRIIIAGARKGLFDRKDFFLHVARESHSDVKEYVFPEYVSCDEAILNPLIADDDPLHKITNHDDDVTERLSYIDEGENVWNAKRLTDDLKLKKTKNTLSQIYRRLKRGEPSYTVTGSGGGGTHIYHWEDDRALTNRERARLQTFSDDYKFFGNRTEVRKQIGMAVPVLGAKHIFTAVLNSLLDNGKSFDPILFEEPNIESFGEEYLLQESIF